ncbi:alpha-(1,3)-fucosyltransferase C-like isoform X2 [Panulirus ornatus]
MVQRAWCGLRTCWTGRRAWWTRLRQLMAVAAAALVVYITPLLNLFSATCHLYLKEEPQYAGDSLVEDWTPPKRILVWTSLWSIDDTWDQVFYRLTSRQCEVSDCELVFHHRLLDTADAIVFHALDLHPHYLLPPRRTQDQLWIFFSLEPPPVIVGTNKVNLTRVAGVFNWTMTYRRDSDVVVPYGRVILRPQSDPIPPAKDYWASKTFEKIAVWMVSRCNSSSQRELFVQELAQYMEVDVFGKCGPLKCGRSVNLLTMGTFRNEDCDAVIGQYMFYLSLENSICNDYVTEKLYKILQMDVVPVVLGGADYSSMAPPGSYINAADFHSPRLLAQYLMTVASNSTLYNKYMEWKSHYQVELGHPFSPMVCDLCAKLNNNNNNNNNNNGSSNNNNNKKTTSTTPQSWLTAAATGRRVPGRDHTGSYPDILSWYVEGAACRGWQTGPLNLTTIYRHTPTRSTGN